MNGKRIVVTGMGLVSPVGNSVKESWNSLINGISGIDLITSFDTTEYPSKIAGEVKGMDFSHLLDPKEVRRTDRFILLALAAAEEAVRHAKLDSSKIDSSRIGTIIGSGIGGIITLEDEAKKLYEKGPKRISPFLIPMLISDMASGYVSIKHGFRGPNYATVSACASSANAIGNAMVYMKNGMIDVAVVGGSEAAISKIGVAGFCSAKALSTRNDTPKKASSPFDIKRDGFVIAEGSGIVVLETLEHALARKAEIYAEFVGYGLSADAYHITAPDPEGNGAISSMKMALAMANIAPEKIDYINAHGTSTLLNDKIESAAIRTVFGDYASSVSISSTKSMTGHLLGAAGVTEFIASVLAIKHGIVPPTINYEDPDPDCPLNYVPNKAIEKKIRYVLSNSFGFGGHNASLIVKHYDPSEKF